MKCSANEVMTLAAKAARGAGAPPAQAAAFGKAVVCHLVAGRSLVEVEEAMAALPGGPILRLPVDMARILEAGGQGTLQKSDLTLSYLEAQAFAVNVVNEGDTLSVAFDLKTPQTPKPVARLDLPEQVQAGWQAIAAKTLVPESDASRLSGAGAGLTDND